MHANFPIHHSSGRVQWSFSAREPQERCPTRPTFRWRAEVHAPGLRRAFEGATPGDLPPTPRAAFEAAKRGDRRLASFRASA